MDFSFPIRFVPHAQWTIRSLDDSFLRRFVPWTFRSLDDSFPGRFVPRAGDSVVKHM